MAVRYASRHKKSAMSPLTMLGLGLATVVGVLLVLHVTGVYTLPMFEEDAPPPIDRTGQVRLHASGRPIDAYSRVDRKDLMTQQGPAWTWLPEEMVPENACTELVQILGRVLKYDKPAGYIFTFDDFYPEGTRPGPSAGVPPGKRAMRLRASDIPGLHGLNQGDHFDLVMTQVPEMEKQSPSRPARSRNPLDLEGPYAELANVPTPEETRVKVTRRRADVQVVVENGTIVQPIHQRKEIERRSSLLRGTKQVEVPVEEIIVAVSPEEVAAVNMALAVGAKLQVAMRSGQVVEGDADDARIPEIVVVVEQEDLPEGAPSTLSPAVRVVEVIRGGNLRLEAVPNRGDGDSDE